MWRTIKIDVQVGELTLPKILQSEKSFADTSGEWNLILVNRNHYIPNNYQVELTELSNGKKVDSRIYPELQQMFNDARAEGLALFVREGYRTTEEQQKIMDEKINEYEKQGYSAKEAKKRAEKYVAIPDTSEHQLEFYLHYREMLFLPEVLLITDLELKFHFPKVLQPVLQQKYDSVRSL